MPTPSTNFRDLLPLIENDFLMVYESDYLRNRLYYTISVNGEVVPYVRTRILMGRNNRTRISFIISTPVDDAQTLLYLSEMDIIDVIYRLEPDLYEHLMDSLSKVFRGEIVTTDNSVSIEREQLFGDITSFSKTATTGVVLLPEIEARSVKTPFGITFSYKTFCDFLSLSLSTEGDEKLKRVVTKYYVISHLLRNETGETPVPPQLRRLHTLRQIKGFYAKLKVTEAMKLDEVIFSYDNYANYFQTR